MASLRLENLSKDYDSVQAVKSLSLDVADGEFIVMLGPSGAGKTTTLKLIAGVVTPTDGKVYIGDRLVNAIEPHKRNVAMAFESYALYPHKNVKQNLAFPLKAPGRKLPAAEIEQRVMGVAEMLNIHMLLDRLPQHLSNGQKQRVALGRAMVREPEVLLLDEPISHLDAKLRHRMRTEFKALETEIHTTTVYVTHDYLEALSLGDRLVVLNEGEIQQTGMPDDVFLNPANVFVSKLLGHPQINLIPCKIFRDGDALQLISLDGAIRMGVPAHLHGAIAAYGGDQLIAGIRPLHMTVVAHGVNGEAGLNQCNGLVYVYERLGTKGVLTAAVGKQQLDVITPIEMSFDYDEAITLGIDTERILLFDPESEKNIQQL
ncbi:MAG: ABC transporter ATP-binding protein [Caldilineaceae bacterium]|nr:ABC transporter ATP-binding protein [Caldilineaceae bacterium]MCB0156619.1 ABC transporter ATP-binding protein [Caldilineaceae bacterium]MCB9161289.1 ABC transporter ATP-binding protein [Caldilineaceae bacterium]